MVKIINGEIVQDDDPRLRQRQQSTSKPQNAENLSFGNPETQIPRMSPFDLLAKILKIENLFVTLPAIPQVGLPLPSRIELVYLLLVGILYLIFDYKAIIFACVMFIMYNQGQSNSNQQAPSPPNPNTRNPPRR